jgi:hypothetical protein
MHYAMMRYLRIAAVIGLCFMQTGCSTMTNPVMQLLGIPFAILNALMGLVNSPAGQAAAGAMLL